MKSDFRFALLRKYAASEKLHNCFLALGLMLLLPGCDSARKTPDRASSARQSALPVRKVQTVRVAEQRIERSVIALGCLLAFEQATISAKVPGRVQEILVDIGSRVQRGDILAIMEPIDYQLKVQQAAAALSGSRRLGLAAGQRKRSG